MLNTCTNPIVYATSVPEFQLLVKNVFCCKRGNKLHDMGEMAVMESVTTAKRVAFTTTTTTTLVDRSRGSL